MQATNGDIWQAREAVSEILKERLPVKTAYWLAKLARKVDEHLRDIDTVRVKLVQQYGVTDEKGTTTVSRESEHWAEFNAELSELMDQTVELEGLPMEKIALPSDNGLCVTPAHLMALEPFVEVS